MESIFNKVASLNVCKFIKTRLQHKCFPVKFEKCLGTPILKEHLRKTGCATQQAVVNSISPIVRLILTLSTKCLTLVSLRIIDYETKIDDFFPKA